MAELCAAAIVIFDLVNCFPIKSIAAHPIWRVDKDIFSWFCLMAMRNLKLTIQSNSTVVSNLSGFVDWRWGRGNGSMLVAGTRNSIYTSSGHAQPLFTQMELPACARLPAVHGSRTVGPCMLTRMLTSAIRFWTGHGLEVEDPCNSTRQRKESIWALVEAFLLKQWIEQKR